MGWEQPKLEDDKDKVLLVDGEGKEEGVEEKEDDPCEKGK